MAQNRRGRYRRWLVTWLVAWRFLAVGLAAALWLVNPGRFLKGPMTRLVHLFAPHEGMSDGLARLLAVLLITSAAYIVLAVIPWRIMEECLVHHFFSTAERCSGARQPDSTEPPRQAMARAVD
jgi:hypothetical protein